MFAVGPNPWMHYKYADKYNPYNVEEAQHDTASSSRIMDNDTKKTKSSAYPIRKEVKTEAKHAKSHKYATWVKTKEVAEHVKDGIAKSVEITLGSVKPGDVSADVVDVRKITVIKENYVLENTESDMHDVFVAKTRTRDDIKARVDSLLTQSKEYTNVDLNAKRACRLGYAGRDRKKKRRINVDEKAKIDRELKNIAHCILGSFNDEADDEADAILENDQKVAVSGKGYENSTDSDENAIQQQKDRTISLTEKETEPVNIDLAAIWKVDEKFEITKDVVGDDYISIDAFATDKNICSLAQQNKDLDSIIADLKHI